MEASLRKGIFSAVDVLTRKMEGRASQARSREKQFLEAEPSVAQSGCWRQKHSAGLSRRKEQRPTLGAG